MSKIGRSMSIVAETEKIAYPSKFVFEIKTAIFWRIGESPECYERSRRKPTHRWTDSAVSAGVVLKAIRASGASRCTRLRIFSKRRRCSGGLRNPAPITT